MTRMISSTAALLAAITFAFGLVCGQAWERNHSHSTARGTQRPIASASSALPANHPPAGDRDLGDAVRITAQLQARTAATSSGAATASDADTWLSKADALRRQRKHAAAVDLYRRAIAAGVMTADSWADFADALAAGSSGLRGEPAEALARALELDPRHPKALWLQASLEHEQHEYARAVKTWQRLLALVPRDSSDATIIRANIAEATRLSARRS
jgi:cytochrome c-type biogenesis protein CcmH/NrfG